MDPPPEEPPPVVPTVLQMRDDTLRLHTLPLPPVVSPFFLILASARRARGARPLPKTSDFIPLRVEFLMGGPSNLSIRLVVDSKRTKECDPPPCQLLFFFLFSFLVFSWNRSPPTMLPFSAVRKSQFAILVACLLPLLLSLLFFRRRDVFSPFFLFLPCLFLFCPMSTE